MAESGYERFVSFLSFKFVGFCNSPEQIVWHGTSSRTYGRMVCIKWQRGRSTNLKASWRLPSLSYIPQKMTWSNDINCAQAWTQSLLYLHSVLLFWWHKLSLKLLKQCSFNLAPQMCITKETKWHPYSCYHDNSCRWCCLNKNWNLQFLS